MKTILTICSVFLLSVSVFASDEPKPKAKETVQQTTQAKTSDTEEPLTDVDLRELRRIRRLQELGVNMQGIEIILRMRRRIQELQAELGRWERGRDGFTAVEVQEIWQRLLPWYPDSE